MCPGRRAFGSCLVVAPGSVAHGHHNPGAAAPAAPVAGVIAVFGAWGGRQLAYSCRVSSCCLGGITTIGCDTPATRRHGGSMVVKSPVARRGCAVGCRCCAQRAVHLGRMRRKSGVWGEVDYVVGTVLRCWACAIGPRQRGRPRQCGRPGRRRRCEGWLAASSRPVVACGGS